MVWDEDGPMPTLNMSKILRNIRAYTAQTKTAAYRNKTGGGEFTTWVKF
ncbi:hypothetical protein thalar_00294 [Litoreibacter arenae DSM 19593]|uniref:Uncharacterized protein n=1 Tax=Litoreibacter arenae DSM 19593 TaxID=1123360 RepID=S9QQ08_9RHOB|nr:hypothetical protein thalar_00294 [Litoreibacter arenae DSM 19593]